MVNKIKNLHSYLKLFFCIWRATVIRKMAYPFDLFLITLAVSFQMFLTIIFANVVYGKFEKLAGLNFHQILLIIGTAMIVDGLAWNSFRPGLGRLDRDIIAGRLDIFLSKPRDSQFLQNFQMMDFEDLSRCVIGGFLIISNLKYIVGFNFAFAILYPFLIIEAMIILWALCSLTSAVAFRLHYIPSFYLLSETIMKLTQYPGDIFKGAAKIIFLTVLPIIFIATIPGKALAGIIDPWYLVGSIIVTIAFYKLARWVWHHEIRLYSSAGG